MDILEKIELMIGEEAPHWKVVIRKGKKQKKLICPDGFKAKDGKCERMDRTEIVKRSKSAKKAQQKLAKNTAKMEKKAKKMAKSIKKLHKLVPSAASEPGKQANI